ncbi:MAG: hypothetical protein B7Z10_08035 [Rhodobacterales bacterium 32-66-7]|nr:MAG: hypothetical protein B7Z31_04775 [Rhodobacterales bacterium 12-65-15]OYX24854.1 MAG: hypothetical protein B7Z10_08035 [Rhodobacterales bacterium 32-66-7]OZA16930.1 MAG: hypothetical protein B7Y02_02740 [Rhodobacterales bacterium 17-64-5]
MGLSGNSSASALERRSLPGRALGLILALLAGPAFADLAALPKPAQDSLHARAKAMSSALILGDAAAGFDMLPPALVTQMSALLGQSEAEFRVRFIENMQTNRVDTGVTAHHLDLANATVFDGSDGRSYALIPTFSQAYDPYRGTFRVEGTTVAIPSADTWYFFTISDAATLDLLVAAYPALADAPLVPVTLTPEP